MFNHINTNSLPKAIFLEGCLFVDFTDRYQQPIQAMWFLLLKYPFEYQSYH